ncbi:hypothetical protein ACTTAM_04815 [Rhodobacter capsulatus]|uniref:hypothetical protein n=1 Tax=Rhodobacter capsulatus TaxID=1061 RepID=UPI004027A14F
MAQLPLWEMKHDWGLAGQRGLERLGARDEAALAERLQQLATAEGRWQFEHAAETGAPALDRLRAAVTLWPAGAAWPEGLAETLAGICGRRIWAAVPRRRAAAAAAARWFWPIFCRKCPDRRRFS